MFTLHYFFKKLTSFIFKKKSVVRSVKDIKLWGVFNLQYYMFPQNQEKMLIGNALFKKKCIKDLL